MNINFRVLIKILGVLALIEGLFLLPCAAVGIVFKEWGSAGALFEVGIFSVCIGFVILTQYHFDKIKLHSHEGYLIACLSWLFCSMIGALPFYFSGQGYPMVQSFFESVAGFTTTGCSVFDLATMPRSLLLWKSVSNWLGGMGILVLLVSIFPALGISGQVIASAEATGPTLEKIGGRFSDTGRVLYLTYLFFSFAEFVLLALGPLSIFDALISTFSSISTAGLVITPANAAAFDTVYVRAVIMIFTLLSSLNYTLFYFMLRGDFKTVLQNVETKFFAIIIIGATLAIAVSLKISGTYASLWQAVKDALCQVVAFISTSGYFVCDYTQWPTFAVIVLFSLLFVGGCCMSTSGSLKIMRVIVFLKLIKRGIFRQIHPRAVKAVVIDGRAIPADKVSAITTHILLFFAFFFFSALVLGLNNFDLETTISTSIGLFSNTGMALGEAGASGYFGMFNSFSQFYMCFMMIAGRLEIYAVLLLFSKSFWKIDSVSSI